MIRIDSLNKAYGDKKLLDNISYHFPEGEKIALIGANGQGKTTLLNILTGQDFSDSGNITKPKDCTIGYLPQTHNPNPEETIFTECLTGHKTLSSLKHQMDEILHKMAVNYEEHDYDNYDHFLKQYENLGGYQLEGKCERILLGLGFKREQFEVHPSTLSGGWRMRLELGKLLLLNPDFLILDEPTNHLDLPSIEWLENYLSQYSGTLLFVSHDKTLLNNLATVTIYLNGGDIKAYTGNFDAFIEQRDLIAQTQGSTARKIVQQKAHMQKFVDRFKASATKAKQAQSRMKMIDKLDEVLSGIKTEEAAARIHFPKLDVPKSGKDVLQIRDLVIGYESPLSKKFNMMVHKGDRIAIIGANGIGKSTFLKTVMGIIPSLDGEMKVGHNVFMGHFAQNSADVLDKSLTVFETLQSANGELSEQTVRGMLGAFLFKRNDIMKKVSVLSGGERTRLSLACILSKKPNLLLLDEPTNHLDMLSTEILGETLKSFQGTLIFVSHDRDFVDNVANRLVEVCENGKWTVY
jgi:ATP-binding cassette subfamily F protein 3